MAASTQCTCMFVVVLLIGVSLAGGGVPTADAARAAPGSSPLVNDCMKGPFPKLCVRELGSRLRDIQTALASASTRGAQIAGVPGQVDFAALVSVAMQAATEAGAVAATVFEGKLPGFNNSATDLRTCLQNCSMAMRTAMKKLHGAQAALKAGSSEVAKTLANRAVTDVSTCNLSCRSITGDVRLILDQSLIQFQKMIRIAITFLCKLKPKPKPKITPPSAPPTMSPPMTPPVTSPMTPPMTPPLP